MTKESIRHDLSEIRYYYSQKALFDKGNFKVVKSTIEDKIAMYAKAIESAPARLYAVYVGLYVENNTQLSLSQKWGYSEGYIKILNGQLCEFLLRSLTNKSKEV